MGADFVGIGRPIAYGMIADSKTGIDTVLSNLISEFTAAMRMAGISSLDQIKNIETIKRF